MVTKFLGIFNIFSTIDDCSETLKHDAHQTST